MTKFKAAIISVLVIVGLGTPLVVQNQAQVKLRAQIQSLKRQVDRLVPLSAENLRLSNLVSQMNGAASRSKDEANEMLKLRGEAMQLRAQAQQLAQLKIPADRTESDQETWLALVAKLKQRLEQMPDAKTPEFQLLTEENWLSAAKNLRRETEEEFHLASFYLRQDAMNMFCALAVPALRNFIKANDGQLPNDLSQLKPYFASPVDDAILQRYEMLKTGKSTDLPPADLLVGEKDPVGGNRFSFGLAGSAWKPAWLQSAQRAFSAANNGEEPTALAPLLPYLNSQDERDDLKRMMKDTGQSNAP